MLSNREFVLESGEITTQHVNGAPLTDGSHNTIAKGYFDDEGKPVVTWINGSGEQEIKFNSIQAMGNHVAFLDAEHCRVTEVIDESGNRSEDEMCFPILRLPF